MLPKSIGGYFRTYKKCYFLTVVCNSQAFNGGDIHASRTTYYSKVL